MESSHPPSLSDQKLYNYESTSGHIWTKSLDDAENLIFKYYDPSLKEEKDVKKIKDE